ncbi:MAG: DNA cytosine methyltransferase [Paludibacteraceae bacterium]|nr:DNA cytosine methyltransferase [Paludibacteraceae bacterium]
MKVVDLFAGCGGLSLGFQNAGFNVVAAFDNWDASIEVYRKNFSHPILKEDLRDIERSIEDIQQFSPDMIIGGPPCQDFSSAGKRNEDNGRGDLTVCYAKIISEIRPKWFVMENVERILKTNKLVEAKNIYKEAGYGLTQMVLDASLCGVPQKRKRFVLIGKYGEQDGFMDSFLSKNLSSKSMTMFDYFGHSLGLEYYYRHPRSYARRGVFSIYEPSPTIRGVNRPMPKGYSLHAGDPVSSLDNIRPLTTKERSLVQTFPEKFVFSGSKTDIEQMIGNAVPVNLANFIAKAIVEYMSNPMGISKLTLFD